MKNILFLCTGNSCRSQMAEGFAHELYDNEFNIYSAGTKKHGMNEIAVKVMLEAGVDISAQYSKTTDELRGTEMDYVFTVCSDAHENCPYFPAGKVIHIGFDDPPRLSKGLKSEKEILSIYRKVRDEIKLEISKLKEYL